ncbi:beta-ketoacyl-[acyl-carrier-protein] synthase family protein [Chelatococcus asaccharovorans]|uniref:Nodulation protein E n=1 Tax=Chelatococcus asaccharovorans TaxID=28210 RepID=A0A2V3UIY4_9HYPH|nr:beta-ketoacyl-[acyl-carrier-protein] synthase family protein [Chelatococcus asaccharovorans]MBS7706255.1 beta-ketoacyl-[acyl-carrier-protein] synthase family protein [Chelatococcus asaccharovorans]PXW65109.1 nodulation protein E [Chelatococcus asaccharovorans]
MTCVAVTGFGVVSAAGLDRGAFGRSLFEGRSAVGDLMLPRSVGRHSFRAAQIATLPRRAADMAGEGRAYDRFSVLALLAAEEAIAAAGLDEADLAGEHTSVLLGTGIGGATAIDDSHYGIYAEQRRPDPLNIPRLMAHAAPALLSRRWGCRGTVLAVSSACASGAQAIGLGMGFIRAGLAERVLVGGSEASLTPAAMQSWRAMRVLTSTRCRPFSTARDGMVLGEGAAVFVLESEQSAQRRGAPILARLRGYGTTSDAGDLVRPDPEGAAAAIRAALADAALPPHEINHVNAHGTGTRLNDAAEAQALQAVFGANAARIPLSATKPIHGHALGASGAIELIATILALQHRSAPGTLGFEAGQGAFPLSISASNQPIDGAIGLSTSFAFGGVNAALIVDAPALASL